MISIRVIESLISFTVLAFAYVLIGSLAGYFQTYNASKMGDDTAVDQGFLTLNPLMHIDPIGMMFLLYLGIGWTRHIPINPHNIRGSWRVAWAYLSQVCMYIFLAFLALITLELTFGHNVITLVVPMVMMHTASLSAFNAMYPTYHSSLLVCALLLVSIMYLALLLAVLDIIFIGIRVIFHIYDAQAAQNQLLLFLISMCAILLFGNTLKWYILVTLHAASTVIAHLFGMA